MTLAADRWPAFVPPGPAADRRAQGAVVVWRWELAKLRGQTRVLVVVGLCVLAPFLVAGAVEAQSAVPEDTLFGQWLHTSGFALPLVVLGFVGQWVLPLLTAVVAGDIFSADDRFGTWKTILTRSRSRGELFAGKVLAALTYTLMTVVVLTAASLAAGLVLGTQPVVGLSGQTVTAGHAAALVVASWATQVPPVLGFGALAVVLSVTTRNSAIGMGGPVLIDLVMQLSTLIDMPVPLRAALLATPFESWHGLWVQAPFYGPLREGLVTSAIWFVLCLAVAWVSFRRRSITTS